MHSCLWASCMSETSWLRLTEDLGLTSRTYCVERFPPPTEWINYTCPPWGASHFGGVHRRLFRPQIFLQYIQTEVSLQLDQRTQESSQQRSVNICLPKKSSSLFCDSAALNIGFIFDDAFNNSDLEKETFYSPKVVKCSSELNRQTLVSLQGVWAAACCYSSWFSARKDDGTFGDCLWVLSQTHSSNKRGARCGFRYKDCLTPESRGD